MSTPHDAGLLAAYVENRLDARERDVVTVHLAGCSECRQVLALLARAAGSGFLSVPAPAAQERPGLGRRWLALAATLVIVGAAISRVNWSPVPEDEAPPSAPPPGVSTFPPAAPRETPVAPSTSPPASEARDVRPERLDPALLAKRGAGRRVAGKTFRLAAGEWVDTAFDAAAGLPTTVANGPGERSALLSRLPALAPYAALGERVVVVFEGTVYRFAP